MTSTIPKNHLRNHGPLSEEEQAELSALLSVIHPLYQQAIEDGVSCLPSHMRSRAKLDWCRRWEQD